MTFCRSIFSVVLLVAGLGAHATTLNTTGTQADFATQYAASSSGDTILFPLNGGPFTWGGGTQTAVSKAITVDMNGSTINLNTGSSTYGTATIAISGPTRWTNGTINGTTTVNTTTFSVANTGWRIDHITWTGKVVTSNADEYAVYVIAGADAGSIDNNTCTGSIGTSEIIFGYGPTNAWASSNGLGTAHGIFIEDNTFAGNGYVCDANSNAHFILIGNTITGAMKIDGHGLASNTPATGVRCMEVLSNSWTYSGGYWTAFEPRGGTGMCINNTTTNTTSAWISPAEYGTQAQWGNFNSTFQTPNNYPVGYQIGTGQIVTINATAITKYEMVTILTLGSTSWGAIGDPAGTPAIGDQFIATSNGSGTGTATTTPGATEPYYFVHNLQNGSAWPFAWEDSQIAAGAQTLWNTQNSTSGQTFTIEGSAGGTTSIIHANQDYFASVTSFNGSAGCGYGTKAQMTAITPSKKGVAFWVTDEGSWNTKVTAGTSGVLYICQDGATWPNSPSYVPYNYPFYSAGGGGTNAVVANGPSQVRANSGHNF